MPPKPKTKQWGHKDKKRLFDLIKENNVDITNTSPKNIKVIWQDYFSHQDSKNFCFNFWDFAASLDLETEYNGARQREAGKSQYFFISF